MNMKVIFNKNDLENFKSMGLNKLDIERIRSYLYDEAYDFARELKNKGGD